MGKGFGQIFLEWGYTFLEWGYAFHVSAHEELSTANLRGKDMKTSLGFYFMPWRMTAMGLVGSFWGQSWPTRHSFLFGFLLVLFSPPPLSLFLSPSPRLSLSLYVCVWGREWECSKCICTQCVCTPGVHKHDFCRSLCSCCCFVDLFALVVGSVFSTMRDKFGVFVFSLLELV